MKIIIDKNIPKIQGAFERIAAVSYLSYKEMTPDVVKAADALIIRTRTKCDESLLGGSKVKFIATATIGFDHIDTDYCDKNGIAWTNAPGCNALSVTQYIASALAYLSKKNSFDLSGKTIGIVGVGHVGKKIEQLAKSFGMRVLLNDPPRERAEGSDKFVALEKICEQADIITFHPLLNMDGMDKTFHLADENFFQALKRKPVFINASRGETVDTNALLSAIKSEMVSNVVLDTWENEPEINIELLEKCLLSTPHIAGYSADGKSNATMQCVQAVGRFFNFGLDNWRPEKLASPPDTHFASEDALDFLLKTYDIEKDSEKLKKSPQTFEQQRSEYWFRREPKGYEEMIPERLLQNLKTNFKVFFP